MKVTIDTAIKDTNLSARAIFGLEAMDIHTVADLMRPEIHELKALSKETLIEVLELRESVLVDLYNGMIDDTEEEALPKIAGQAFIPCVRESRDGCYQGKAMVNLAHVRAIQSEIASERSTAVIVTGNGDDFYYSEHTYEELIKKTTKL